MSRQLLTVLVLSSMASTGCGLLSDRLGDLGDLAGEVVRRARPLAEEAFRAAATDALAQLGERVVAGDDLGVDLDRLVDVVLVRVTPELVRAVQDALWGVLGPLGLGAGLAGGGYAVYRRRRRGGGGEDIVTGDPPTGGAA